MAKFCGKCGAELKEGSKFCVNCGTPVPGAGAAGNAGQMGTQQVYQQSAYAGAQAAKKPFPVKLIVIPIVAVVVLIAVLFGVFGSKGYEKPIKYIEQGMNEGDLETLMKAFPEGMSDLAGLLPEDLSDFFPEYDVKMEVVDKEKLEKKEIATVLSDEFGVTAMELKDVKAAYILDVEMSTEIDGEEESDEQEIPVIKKDGKWVIPLSAMY